MRTLVTGATGKVGHAIARRLAADGHTVRALARDPARAAAVLPPGVEAVPGDIRDPAAVAVAVGGCDLVFNAMGLPEQWLRDPRQFEEVNALGTRTLARAAAAAGVRRLVHVSTIDVFDAPPGLPFAEDAVAREPKHTPYERSKQDAEAHALAARGPLEVVLVNPGAVYGPPPNGPASLEETLFRPLIRGRLPALPPGGLSIVFADALADGAVRAAEHGRDGERYILVDEHMPMRELARRVVAVAGRGRVPPTLPRPLARALATGSETLARTTRRPPLLPKGQLEFLLWDAHASAGRAREELGWTPCTLADGLPRALAASGLPVAA